MPSPPDARRRFRAAFIRAYPWIATTLGCVGLAAAFLLSRFDPQADASASAPLPPVEEVRALAGDPDLLEQGLLAAFEGSFPEEASPHGEVVDFEFTAAPSEIELFPDYQTRVWSYDGQVPGPTLRVRLGQTVRVNFTNQLPQPTTIHWHGVRVPNAMDGVPGVTQPPIQPGESFVYEFTPKDAGTYWFHPHVRGAEQLERGLYGILIVEDAEPAPFDRDLVWVLDDWLLMEDAQIYDQFVTGADISHDGRWGNIPSINGKLKPTFTFKPGERIRLRLINSANARIFRPVLTDLEPRGIAFDGMTASRPFDPNGYDLAPGNRLDLDITIPRRLRGQTVAIVDRFMQQPFVLAEIEVEDAEPVENEPFPIPASAHLPDWSEATRLPLAMELRMNARQGGKYGIEWTINEQAWPDSDGFRLEHGRLHRLRIVNQSFRLHPMHIHGQFFRLLSRNGRPVAEPHWRDTVLVWPEETIEIAMVPLDRGQWMSHCHIQEHAEAGMMTLLEVY